MQVLLRTQYTISICDSGVVGNARPCQGRDRGFEPRLSLFLKDILSDIFFYCVVSDGTTLPQCAFLSPLRSGRRKADVHRTSCARLSLFFYFISDFLTKSMIYLITQAGDMPSSDPSLTERMIIMVTWNDLFTFVIMTLAILTYIDQHGKHKK